MQVKLPACISLGTAGRDTSWRALLTHLRNKASAVDASTLLKEDASAVGRAWNTIRRRFKRRGVHVPRQLMLNPHLPTMRKNPSWLTPLRRALRAADTPLLFPRLDRGSVCLEVPMHKALLHDVLRGLQQQDVLVVIPIFLPQFFCPKIGPKFISEGSSEPSDDRNVPIYIYTYIYYMYVHILCS